MTFSARFLRVVAGALLFLVCVSSDLSGQTASPPLPEANPARPTVSTPATLSPVGYLQFENGGFYARDSAEFADRLSFQQVTKLTVHPRLELILQSEPLVASNAAGENQFQAGGVSGGAQAVLLHGQKSTPTIAVNYLRSIYSGPAPDIDIGSATQTAAILLSEDLWGFHADLNGIVGEQQLNAVRRAQWGETLAVSHPVRHFVVAGEIWHFSQPLVPGNTTGTLWAVSYAAQKNLVLDVAVDHGFNETSTRWQVLFGFTYVLPQRLWKSREAPE